VLEDYSIEGVSEIFIESTATSIAIEEGYLLEEEVI
jgi:hypothetical protein